MKLITVYIDQQPLKLILETYPWFLSQHEKRNDEGKSLSADA
jgi:hypothetical protein